MDQFDIALLHEMQNDCRQTADTLSGKIGLSPAACQKRLKRLRDTGVITRDISVLADDAINRLTLIVEIVIERGSSELMDEFCMKMKASPLVMQCYYVTGETDFFLLMSVRNMAEYDSFTRKHFVTEHNVRRFQTHVVRSEVKVTLSKPLENA